MSIARSLHTIIVRSSTDSLTVLHCLQIDADFIAMYQASYGVPDPSTATALEDGVAETTGDGDEGNREGEGPANQGYNDNGSGDNGIARGTNGASQVSGGRYMVGSEWWVVHGGQ